MKYNYYNLKDPVNKGMIVRTNGSNHYCYTAGKWTPTAIMVGNFYPDSLYYDHYEDISRKRQTN